MKNSVLSALALGMAMIVAGTPVLAAGKNAAKTPQAVEPKPVVDAAPAPSGAANNITQAVFNAGAMACAPRVNQITNFLIAGGENGAFLFVPPKDVDKAMISVSMEIQAPNTPLAYASASFSPGTRIGCGGMYETVVYWNGACSAVAGQVFKDAKVVGPLMKSITILEIANSARIFLMPAGTGCVSIKKEVMM
jgi:hypothetical protein